MGFTIEFDEAWMKREAPRSGVLFVEPNNGVLQDEWDGFDSLGEYVDTYSTEELVSIQRQKVTTVLNRFSNHPWSASQEKPAGKRKRRKPGRRKVFAAHYNAAG